MSKLLQRKDLKNRGPKIEPKSSFKLEESETAAIGEVISEQPPELEVKKPGRPKTVQDGQVSSVRIMKGTRNKLNALVQMGKAENADILIDHLIDLYLDEHLSEDEKRVYGIFKETFDKK